MFQASLVWIFIGNAICGKTILFKYCRYLLILLINGVTMPVIHAIIITYNPDRDNVISLAAALEKQVNHTWIIDNGSSIDISQNFELISNASFVRLNENVGIAKAQNIAIEYGEKKGAEFFVFFDQDSVIGNDFVYGLYSSYAHLNQSRKIAAVGPVFEDSRFKFMYPQIKLNSIGIRKRIVPKHNTGPLALSFIISSGMLTSVAVLNDIGNMNEDLFIDYVDTEWCLRAIKCGYEIFADTGVCMQHSIGDNNIKFLVWKLPVHSPMRRYYRMRNMYYLFKMKHVPFIMKAREFITNTIHQFLITLASKQKFSYFKFWIKSQRDGLVYFFSK